MESFADKSAKPLEMNNKKIIFSIIILLAVVEMGVFGFVEFFQDYGKSMPEIKKVVTVSEVAPAALSGKWKLIK